MPARPLRHRLGLIALLPALFLTACAPGTGLGSILPSGSASSTINRTPGPIFLTNTGIGLYNAGPAGNRFDLVLDLKGTNGLRLVRSNSFSVAPDGRHVVFVANSGAAGGSIHAYVVNADGTGQVQIGDDSLEIDDTPLWSPDGQSLAFWGRTIAAGTSVRSDSAPYVAKVDGGGVTKLSSAMVKGSLANSFVWSQDSQRLAYARNEQVLAADGKRNEVRIGIYVAARSGGEAQRIRQLDPLKPLNTLFWAGNGKRLRYRSGQDELTTVDDSGSIVGTFAGFKFENGHFTPNGDRFVSLKTGTPVAGQTINEVTVTEIDSQSTVTLTSDGATEKDVQSISPDGTLAAFHTNRKGSPTDPKNAALLGTFVVPLAGGSPVRLTPVGKSAGTGVWSVDSKRLLVTGTEKVAVSTQPLTYKDNQFIFTVNADGTGYRSLIDLDKLEDEQGGADSQILLHGWR